MAEVDPVDGQDNPEADERPEWLPQNFNSPEDLAASYKESQRKITELSTQNKGLEESFSTLSQQFEAFTTQQNQPDPNEAYAQWQEMYDNNPVGTMTQLAQQVAAQTAQEILSKQRNPSASNREIASTIAIQALEAKFQDFGDYREKAAAVVDQNGWLANEDILDSPQKLQAVYEVAYKTAKAEDLIAAGVTTADQQAEAMRQMKLDAQTASGAGGRPASADEFKTRWDEIQNAPSEKLGL